MATPLANYPMIAEHMTESAVSVLACEDAELFARFSYDHLPLGLQERSAPFRTLAEVIRGTAPLCHDRIAALRKLLECKDATVRCHIPVKS